MAKKVFIDRELSWIEFNLRVLDEAKKPDNPLFEQLKFVSIFQSNFDEFFRVRVGTLCDRRLVEQDKNDKVQHRLEDIYRAARQAYSNADDVYSHIMDSTQLFCAVKPEQLTAADMQLLRERFKRDFAPVISPFIVEKKHPFPFFENSAVVTGFTLQRNGTTKFGFIPITPSLPPIVMLPGDGCRFIQTDELLRLFAPRVFSQFEVIESISFTIIRNADIDENEGLYEYDVDFREKMQKLIELRRKLAPVVLKYIGKRADKLLEHLEKVLFLSKKQLIKQKLPLKMSFFSLLHDAFPYSTHPELYYKPLTPQYPRTLKNRSLIRHIQKHDLLLSYPFDDINVLVDLLTEAAYSKDVRSISISLYRVARDSKIVQLLCEAAKNKKPVHCVVELRARFDEENNIDWSKRLEQAGCHVYYGLPNYKVHCKLLSINMKDNTPDIAMIGTGNFNEVTARLYTDLALFTAAAPIIRDVRAVFASLKKGRFVEKSAHLLVAPLCLKNRLFEMIDEQIQAAQDGKRAEITLKFNSLTDKPLMKKLIEASCAGVKIKMLVRGICCLVPGIPDKTENIEVRSIVGRFLEHSRIYVFGVGRDKQYYISSADFMTRNTDQRVEVATPVYDYTARRKLARLLRLGFMDNTNARLLDENGDYNAASTENRPEMSMQNELYNDVYRKNDTVKKGDNTL